MKNYLFTDVARTERYFTATLLCHMMMSDNFKGLKALFMDNFDSMQCQAQKNEFEVVSELDPLRDGSKYNQEVQKLFKRHKRIAVPDVFLRWGELIIIIEAKFFTMPNPEELEYQVSEQQKALKVVLKETHYIDHVIKYMTLTVKGCNKDKFKDKSIIHKTWDNLIAIFEKEFDVNNNLDISYCLNTLKNSVSRASDEMKKSIVEYQRIKNLDEFLQRIPDLINEGKLYFGFSEGIENLGLMSLEDLSNRDHYKIASQKWSDNWYSIDLLISRIIALKSC